MALVTCPDCESEVSDSAAACPKCARPIKRTASAGSTGKLLVGVGTVLVLGGVVGCIASPSAVSAGAGLGGLALFIVGRLLADN